MNDEQPFDPPTEPPRRFNSLQQTAARYAKHRGVAPIRVQRWISYMIVCGSLDRLRSGDGGPMFVLKGGVTLEMRLGLEARATKDLDAIYLGHKSALLTALDNALAEPYGDFVLRRTTEPEDIGKAVRVEVRLAYRGKSWGTVPLEISLSEGIEINPEQVPALDLGLFGLHGPETISCIPLNLQIAQKIHAMTQPANPGRPPNDRFRDAADLIILRDLIADWPSLRDVCEKTFHGRGTHPWPPAVTVPEHWAESYRALAATLGLPESDINRVAQEIEQLIAQIASS